MGLPWRTSNMDELDKQLIIRKLDKVAEDFISEHFDEKTLDRMKSAGIIADQRGYKLSMIAVLQCELEASIDDYVT